MDHIAGVEVAETLSNIGKLVTGGYRLGGHNGRDTHESHLIRIGVVLDVFQQIPARYPIRNELEGGGGNTLKGENIWVFRVFPYYCLFAEGLGFVSGGTQEK